MDKYADFEIYTCEQNGKFAYNITNSNSFEIGTMDIAESDFEFSSHKEADLAAKKWIDQNF